MTDRTSPPVANTPMLLADILAELRGLRGDLEAYPVGLRRKVDAIADDVAALKGTLPQPEPEPVDGETVELRGVAEQDVVNVIAAKPPAKKRTRS